MRETPLPQRRLGPERAGRNSGQPTRSRRFGASSQLSCSLRVSRPPAGLPAPPYSEATAELIDAEVRDIVEVCQGEATRLLTAHGDKLVALATALLKVEALDEREILEVTGLGPLPGRAAGA